MQFETFDQMFRFREHCLCGAMLEGFFRCATADDEYVTISPRLLNSTAEPNSMSLCLGFEIDSRIVPSGVVYFDLFIKKHSKDFEMRARYLSPPYDQMSAAEFATKHFSSREQKNMAINVHVECSDERCPYGYKSTFGNVVFDLKSRKIEDFSILKERFVLNKDDRKHLIISDFRADITTIQFQKDIIELPAQNFAKYPLDAQFLLDKINTLFLFS